MRKALLPAVILSAIGVAQAMVLAADQLQSGQQQPAATAGQNQAEQSAKMSADQPGSTGQHPDTASQTEGRQGAQPARKTNP